MPNLSLLVKQLKKERDRVEKQLSGLNAALTAFAFHAEPRQLRILRRLTAALSSSM